MDSNYILSKLPYSIPFLFVDKILEVNTESITGEYKFSPELEFYRGHFKNNPVTPGVILTECMAQIGVVCLGIYLTDSQENNEEPSAVVMTSSEIEYLKPVYPGEKVTVISEKQYFRFNKLKCLVKMNDAEGSLVCKGTIAGMIIKSSKG